jgi:hypothetical protein
MRIAIIGGSSSGGWLGAVLAEILYKSSAGVLELVDLIPSSEVYPLPFDIHAPHSFEIYQGGVWESSKTGRLMSILARAGEHMLKGARKLMSISELE